MKVELTFCVSNLTATELLYKMREVESSLHPAEPISFENTGDLDLLDNFLTQSSPMFGVENTIHQTIESLHGYMEVVGHQSWTDNMFAIGITLEDEYSVKDRICSIHFSGARGAFVKFVERYFEKVSCLIDLIRMCDSRPIYQTHDKSGLYPNLTVDLYESKGPEDMLPWETEATYVIRKGSEKQLNAVRGSLRRLAAWGAEISQIIKIEDGKPIYLFSTYIRHTDNLILKHWFEDEENGIARVSRATNYLLSQKLADNLLEQL